MKKQMLAIYLMTTLLFAYSAFIIYFFCLRKELSIKKDVIPVKVEATIATPVELVPVDNTSRSVINFFNDYKLIRNEKINNVLYITYQSKDLELVIVKYKHTDFKESKQDKVYFIRKNGDAIPIIRLSENQNIIYLEDHVDVSEVYYGKIQSLINIK